MMTPSDRLEIGLQPVATVAAFEAACNRDADRLFVTESWFAPFRVRLLAALPANLSSIVVEALRDALYKRRPLETVVQFIEQQPMTWEEFARWRTDRDHADHLEHARAGFFPWADVEASADDQQLQRSQASHAQGEAPAILQAPAIHDDLRARARSCPGCNTSPADLAWVYFSSPEWTWRQLCGRAGWLVVCTRCHLQVDFFLHLMN